MKKFSECNTNEKIKIMYIGVVDIEKTPYAKGTYLLIKATDGESLLVAKKWDYKDGDLLPEKGKIYEISGTKKEYNGSYIDIDSIAESNNPDAISCVTKTAPISKETLKNRIFKAINSLTLPYAKEFVTDMVNGSIIKDTEDFFEIPAAIEIHHVCASGNAWHTLEVLNYAINIAKTTGQAYHKDLIIMGAILHDIGKVKCYKMNGFIPEMTNRGKLNDHIVEGIGLLYEGMNNFCRNNNIAEPSWFKLLVHIVASHHEHLEWGSPIRPAFKEALIVARADNLSAGVSIMDESTKTIDENEIFEKRKNFKFQTHLCDTSKLL